jgi:hypothetical protein
MTMQLPHLRQLVPHRKPAVTTFSSFGVRQLADEAVLAYVAWREESATVWAAYSGWASAGAEDAIGAHAAYRAALDREEAAAHLYAALIGRVSELLRTDIDYAVARRGPA